MARPKTRKGLWLLALLALRHGRAVDRGWLAGTLWPEADEATALAYLRQTLTDLRRALGPAAARLERSAARTLSLHLDGADFDVGRFDELIAGGTPDGLEEAVGLHTGPLLEGCAEEWVIQERESREQVWLSALETLAAGDIEGGRPASAVRRLRQVTAAEPLRESAYRDLMRALDALRDTAAAIETYRELRLLLQRELNAEPDAETRQLFETIRAGARSRAAATASPGIAPPPTRPVPSRLPPSASDEPRTPSTRRAHVRLPRSPSAFFGREREIVAVKRALAASQLVTLTGVGGVGKTRLAVRIAEEVADEFADGAAFVDFTTLSEPSLVPETVAFALGAAQNPSRTRTDACAELLEPRAMLLVLDNCEHVLPAVAELASALLKQCPGLKMVATSRQRLRTAGETEWRVPPLEIPPEPAPGDGSSGEESLRANDAVALFLDRAWRVRPDLPVDTQTLRAAAEVCRRLDGIPLALELAAARLQALTVPQLAARLEERFKLLVVGDMTAPGRQQTLRATLDWSHDLLSDDEKRLLRRLSVFSGGWTLEAAEAVCAAGDGGEPDVLDALASLVDKSLVQFAEAGGEARYSMLETVRQYARERLARSGEEQALRGRHRDHFTAFAEASARHLVGPDQAAWLDRLEREHDNLRAALDWCAEEPSGARAGLRLAGALRRFWSQRGHYAEARARYAALLRLDASAQPTLERALALHGAGNMALAQGDYAGARELFEQSLAIREALGDWASAAQVLTNLGQVAFFQGDYDRARPLLVRALELHRAAGSQPDALVALHGLGNLAFRTGDHAKAREWLEQGIAESRACGDRKMEASLVMSLGFVHESGGDRLSAKGSFERALTINRELGDVAAEMVALTNLGMVARRLGDPPASAQHYRAGLALARERPGNRDERVVAYLLEGVALLEVEAGDPRRAVWLLAAATALRGRIGVPRPPQEVQDFDRAMAAARSTLGQPGFEAAWSEGGAATSDAAMAVALGTTVNAA